MTSRGSLRNPHQNFDLVDQLIEILRRPDPGAIVDIGGAEVLPVRDLLAAISHVDKRFKVWLRDIPAAAYTCDAQGLITDFNLWATELWGREPALNDPRDRY